MATCTTKKAMGFLDDERRPRQRRLVFPSALTGDRMATTQWTTSICIMRLLPMVVSVVQIVVFVRSAFDCYGRLSLSPRSGARARRGSIVDCEEAPSKNAIAGKARQGRFGHRCHIEDVEVRPAEHHARHLLDGHVDDALDHAVRRVADNLTVVGLRVP